MDSNFSILKPHVPEEKIRENLWKNERIIMHNVNGTIIEKDSDYGLYWTFEMDFEGINPVMFNVNHLNEDFDFKEHMNQEQRLEWFFDCVGKAFRDTAFNAYHKGVEDTRQMMKQALGIKK
ncbi:MAG: hypothetical protein GY870_14105 [archaeon]|nr:hypothetical protein [archaeon]